MSKLHADQPLHEPDVVMDVMGLPQWSACPIEIGPEDGRAGVLLILLGAFEKKPERLRLQVLSRGSRIFLPLKKPNGK